MKLKPYFISFFIFFLSVLINFEVKAGSISPTYAPQTTYMQTGFQTLSIGGISSSAINANFTITLNPALSGNSYPTAVAFKQLNLYFYSLVLQTQFKVVSTSSVSFTLNLKVTNPNILTNIIIDYLAIDPTYRDSLYVYYFQSATSTLNYGIRNGSPYNQDFTLPVTISTLSTLKDVTMFSGFSISVQDNTFDLDIYPLSTFTSITNVKLTFSTIISKTVYLNYFSVYIIAYVESEMQAKGYMQFQVGTFSYSTINSNTLYNYVTSNNFVQANTMFLGIKCFHIINQNFLNFRAIISPPSTIQLISTNRFQYVAFQFIIILRFSCVQSPYLFFNVNDGLCYDQNCSVGYYFISINGISWCLGCSYQCYECNSTQCTNCNTSTTYRQLSGNSCVPVNGYYDDGVNLIAQPCSSQCYTCNGPNNNNCLTCDNTTRTLNGTSCSCLYGNYSNGTCMPNCPQRCQTCSNSTTCTQCLSTFSLAGGACQCATGTYYNQNTVSCDSCSSSITNCQACSSNIICTQCLSPFIPINNASSGGTYCGCATQYYQVGNNCVACNSQCYTCNGANNNNCVTCDNTTRRLNGTLCSCIYGAFSNGTCKTNCTQSQQCLLCPTNINTCSQCLSTFSLVNGECQCPTGTYYNQNTVSCNSCSSSIPYCQECDSSILCTKCPTSIPLTNDSSTGGAYCGCTARYYLVRNQCDACSIQCYTCNGPNNNECLSCDQTTRTLNGTYCSCKNGNYSNGTCINNCSLGCLLCPMDTNNCTQCKSSFSLGGGKCRCLSGTYYNVSSISCDQCDPTCFMCSGPTSVECTACDSSLKRELNTTTYECQCSATYYDPGNLTCIKQQVNSTGTCASGFYLNKILGLCSQICGDGKLFQLQCDDGNLDNGDGCDQACNIESDFSCFYGTSSSPSICSYNGSIKFQLKKADKSLFSNQVNLVYQLQPFLKFYQMFYVFDTYLIFNDSVVKIVSAIYDYSQQRLNVLIQYNQTINLKNLELQFTPPNSAYTHAVAVSSAKWKARSTNSMSLTYYDSSEYNNATIFYYLSFTLLTLSQLFFCLSLFFRKMVGLQLMSLIQIQFISFALLQYASPILGSILTWKYIFGYNQWTPQTLVNSNQLISSNYSSLGFKNYFGYNVNCMIFVIAGFYAISIIMFGISFLTSKSQSKKFKDASIIFARQIGFGIMVLCLCNIIISFFIQYDQGILLKIYPIWSFLIKISSFLIIIVNFVVFLLSYKKSVQSYVFYKKDDALGQKTPIFVASRNIIITAAIYMGVNFNGYTLYVAILIQGMYFGFVIWRKPFKRYVDIARSIAIQGGILFVLISRTLQSQFYDPQFPGAVGQFSTFSNYLQYLILACCLGLTMASFIIHLVKASKKQSQIYPQLFEQEEFFKENQKIGQQKQEKEQKYERPVKVKQMYKQKEIPIKPFFKQKKMLDTRQKLGQKLLFSMDQIDHNNSSLGNINTSNGSFFDNEPAANSKRKLNQTQNDDIIQME